MSGTLYIISAPSGAGKTSIVKVLAQKDSSVYVSVSHTTRERRVYEIGGVHYNFIEDSVFKTMIDNNEFLEYAQVFQHYYGTYKNIITQKLEQGLDVILEIDWQGARQIRKLMPESVSIFILPPSIEALSIRLHARASDSIDVIERRMKQARSEIEHYYDYDYIIVNDDFSVAVAELQSIFIANRLLLKNIGKDNAIFKKLLSI